MPNRNSSSNGIRIQSALVEDLAPSLAGVLSLIIISPPICVIDSMKKSDGDSKTRVPSDEEILRTTTTAAFRLPDLLMRGGSPSARSPTHPFQTALHIAVQQTSECERMMLTHEPHDDGARSQGILRRVTALSNLQRTSTPPPVTEGRL